MDRTGLLSSCATLLILGTIYSLYPSADARLQAMPLPRDLKDCYLRAQNYSIQNYVGGMYCWYCEAPVRAHQKGAPTPLKPQQYAYFRNLYKKVEPLTTHGGRRLKRQATAQRCLRKEYRMLTDEERRRFHNAVNGLKNDVTVEPNKYDALALFHRGVATFVAHGGFGFPGWHGVYLQLFEAALQEMDPTVCLPYWDSTLDEALPNPADSYVWSADFFGSWNGDVNFGPFSNWETPDGIVLRRDVGRDGQTFTREGIEALMSRNTYEEILMPDVDPQYSLEVQHGGVHVYVGGDMEGLDTAAYDIIFFMHHAFVDYIWEMFRNKMRNNGLDPEQYPHMEGLSDYHQPHAPMGFGNLTQAEGYLDALRESFEYAPSPECSQRNPDCGSKYLWCDRAAARCMPIDPSNPPVPVPGPNPNPKPCPTPKPQAYQNSFCIDGMCDIKKWVWLPVKIVAQRPPEFSHYQSYPVENGKISKFNDIYEPAGYGDMNRYIKKHPIKPKGYEQCEIKDGVGRIFVSSMGVNYDGTYKESAIMDQRLATSMGVTYIAVKDPGVHGVTETILRAHDQCGRICHTACRIPGTDRYESCSGVLQVTSQGPVQYSQSYAKATLSVYDYASNSDCPSFKSDNFFLTFYCDYRDHLPWVDKAQNPITGPQGPQPSPVVRPSTSNQCRLSPQCTINQPCFKDVSVSSNPRQCEKYMEMKECLDTCGRYAVCIYGVYWPRSCPSGMRFDEFKGHCVRGTCGNVPVITSGGGSGGGNFRPKPVFPPSPPSFGAGSYYGRLLNRFQIGGRG